MEAKTLISKIYKALAILGSVLGLWWFVSGLLAAFGAGLLEEQDGAAQYVTGMEQLLRGVMVLGGSLSLWWMGEVVDLLARIVENTSTRRSHQDDRRSSQPPSSTPRSPRRRDDDDDKTGPPNYVLG